jgi:hypothetical protein
MAKPLKIWNGSQWIEVAANSIDTSQFATTASLPATITTYSQDDQFVLAARIFS